MQINKNFIDTQTVLYKLSRSLYHWTLLNTSMQELRYFTAIISNSALTDPRVHKYLDENLVLYKQAYKFLSQPYITTFPKRLIYLLFIENINNNL